MNFFRLFNQLRKDESFRGKERLISKLQGKPFFTEDQINEIFAYKKMEYHNNPDANKLTEKAFATQDLSEKFRLLRRINGVGMIVASTIIMFQNPHKFAEIDVKTWNILRVKFGLASSEKDERSDYSIQDYSIYMGALKTLADEYGMNVCDVEYVISQSD